MGCAPSLYADTTVAAWTLYGFTFRCCASAHFKPGAPRESGCGTSCTADKFSTPTGHSAAIAKLEAQLDEAAGIANDQLDNCQHLYCPLVGSSTELAAKRLNETWCAQQNKILQQQGLRCFAANELHGFGRSAVRYLVLRVVTE